MIDHMYTQLQQTLTENNESCLKAAGDKSRVARVNHL